MGEELIVLQPLDRRRGFDCLHHYSRFESPDWYHKSSESDDLQHKSREFRKAIWSNYEGWWYLFEALEEWDQLLVLPLLQRLGFRLLNSRTTNSQKCEAVPRRARI